MAPLTGAHERAQLRRSNRAFTSILVPTWTRFLRLTTPTHTHTHTRMLGSQQPLLQVPYETLQRVEQEASRLSWLHSHFQQWSVVVLSVPVCQSRNS